MGPDPAVAAVRVAVRATLSELPAGALVLVACSGGADSLALAAATAFQAPRVGRWAGALTVDHGLQPDSAAHAARVAATCRELGLGPVEVVSVTVGDLGGPEAAARAARYAGLSAAAERLGAAAVLLGHTLDDQAETVLLGLARGSGARSLAGMPAVTAHPVPYRRPLLGCDRGATRAACAAEGLVPWEDPHNRDPAYTRVRLRHDGLPALERALGPGVRRALARTAAQLRDDADALDAWAERAAHACAHPDGGLTVAGLVALPAAVRRRVLHRRAVAEGSPRGTLAAVHIQAVDALLTGWHGQGPVQLPGGVIARRRCGRLLFGHQQGAE